MEDREATELSAIFRFPSRLVQLLRGAGGHGAHPWAEGSCRDPGIARWHFQSAGKAAQHGELGELKWEVGGTSEVRDAWWTGIR